MSIFESFVPSVQAAEHEAAPTLNETRGQPATYCTVC
nr:a3.1 [Pseudozyma pruni]